MDSAFVLIAARDRGVSLSPYEVGLISEPDRPGLGFAAAHHVVRQDPAGTVALGAWQARATTPDDRAWHDGPDGLVAWTGWLRWRDPPWGPEHRWAAELAAATTDARLADVVRGLHGVFAVARLGSTGDVAVASDPLGLRCLYYGENERVACVSTRAALVAEVLAGEGRRPRRDVRSAAWLAFTTYRVGDATGFEDVRVLDPGATIEMGAGRPLAVRPGAPWMPDAALRDLSREELIELARDDLAGSLRAVLARPAGGYVLRLTGGKDSRLLLAVALWTGVADDLDYETIGPPDLPDVRVASELARMFGLRHEVRFVGMAPSRPYEERIREFTTTTGGMLNIWDLADPGEPSGEVTVTGLCGEFLRTHGRRTPGPASVAELRSAVGPGRFGRLGLVEVDLARELQGELEEAVLDDPSRQATPTDLRDALDLRYRQRFCRLGPQEELRGRRRVVPLYSLGAIRAAFALGSEARRIELLHFEIMRRCSERLAGHRFAGPGWDPSLGGAPRPGDGPATGTSSPAPGPGSAVGPAPGPGPRPEAPGNLMQSLQQKAFDQRRDVLRAVLDDERNPAWEVLRRDVAVSALDRFPTLSVTERRELYGAVTAALWLAGD